MFYQGISAQQETCIATGRSTNGLTWDLDDEPILTVATLAKPLETESRQITGLIEPSVLVDKDGFRMWFISSGANEPGNRLHHARSTDGKTRQLDGVGLVSGQTFDPQRPIYYPQVVPHANGFFLYLSLRAKDGSFAVMRGDSADGLRFDGWCEIVHQKFRCRLLGSGPIKLLSGRSAADSLMGGRTPSMSDLFWLSERQLAKIEPHFPLSHGVLRVDDRRVISGIVHVIRNGLRWRDAPPVYGPHKTLYNRFVRWSRLGVFSRIFAALTGEAGPPDRLMIDATHLKAHRTAASLYKKGLFPDVSDAQKAG